MNNFGELIVDEDYHDECGNTINLNRVTDMLTHLYDELVLIYGRADQDIRALNKIIRDFITI